MNLPHPGTLWLHKATSREMRVCIVDCDAEEIIAHNCQQAMRSNNLRMAAWLGSFDEFRRAFTPASTINTK